MGVYRYQAPFVNTVFFTGPRGMADAVRDGNVVEIDDALAAKVRGWYGDGALVAVSPSASAEDAREDQPAPDFPDVGSLSAADVQKLAKALGYDGPRRKAAALAYLQTLDADRVRAALEG